jgi:hypothetical protein
MSQPKPNFLSLPLEVRLSIYRHALINRRRISRRKPYVREPYQISPSMLNEPEDRTKVPAILRTNKQICSEALPILYSENEFMADRAQRFLAWLQQIGPNIKLLKSLRIFPHAVYSESGKNFLGPQDPDYSGPVWCKLLNRLAADATDLERVYVYLDAEVSMGHYGAGKDLNFVRALGRMKVSEKMEITGYFAVEWPRYLERKLGMPVWNEQSQSQDELRWLREYQQGTQNLIP